MADVVLKVEESKTLDDGAYRGVIVDVEQSSEVEGYDYVRFTIETQNRRTGEAVRLSVSYPKYLSSNSMLGRLLQRFGVNLEIGKSVNLGTILVGQKVEFLVHKEKGKDGGIYARVLRDTLKPYIIHTIQKAQNVTAQDLLNYPKDFGEEPFVY